MSRQLCKLSVSEFTTGLPFTGEVAGPCNRSRVFTWKSLFITTEMRAIVAINPGSMGFCDARMWGWAQRDTDVTTSR